MDESTMFESQGVKEALVEAAEDFRKETIEAFGAVAFDDENARDEFDRLLSRWDETAKALPGGKEIAQVLHGYCLLISGQVSEAVQVLQSARKNPWGAYLLSGALARRGHIEAALEVAGAAAEKHGDVVDLTCRQVELLTRLGRTEEAEKLLAKVRKTQQGTAQIFYLEGFLLEKSGEYRKAIDRYRDALRRWSRHLEACFRLGYLLDIYGSESDDLNDEAVSVYETCLKLRPVHSDAVINLGVLYEDRERYHDAIKCYETVLRDHPNDPRAKVYLKDAQASTRMFYDREMEKKADKQSQVLKIPVSDFELSVRSRNCLQKMNIMTLGDLIMKTEQELLSYKNFGETSLTEIKEMLSQKGLSLGQGLDGKGGDAVSGRNPLEATVSVEVLNQSIEDLNFSVRSRRCMERLEVRSVRDLINKTEVELMSAKNFGMTSLNEIKRKLAEIGLSLKS